MKLSISCCRWEGKLNWPWNLIGDPQPATDIRWNPNCPLMKGKKKSMSKSKCNILRIPNSLMHIFPASTSFSVPMEGPPESTAGNPPHCTFCHSCPLFLGIILLGLFHKQRMDHRQRKGRPSW